MVEGSIEVTEVWKGNVCTKSVTLSNFFDDIVMTPPSCRREKGECESCAG